MTGALAIILLAVLGVAVGTFGPASAQTPRRGGVFHVAAADPPGLDPHQLVNFIPQTVYPRYISHPPYVKGFKHHDGYDLGRRLTFTWIEKCWPQPSSPT